jgi:hypothetical protein
VVPEVRQLALHLLIQKEEPVGRYSKLFTALSSAAISALALQLIGGSLTQVGLVNVAIAVVGAAAVYFSPNVPGRAPYSKAIMAGLAAGATLLATLIGAGSLMAVTPAEWSQVGLAVLNTAVVWFVKNSPMPAAARRKAMEA